MRIVKYIIFLACVASVNAGVFGGSRPLASIYAGTNVVQTVYVGTNIVWSSSPLPAGLVRWYDSSDASTITLADTDKVTAWADKSGNGDNAVQIGADSTRPTYPSTTQNGIATIGFDGGDFLGTDYHSVNGQTVFIVAKSTVIGRYIIGARDVSNTRSFIWDNTTVSGAVGANSSISDGVNWGAGFRYVSLDYNSTTVNMYVDGSLLVSEAQNGSGVNPIQGYYIGTFNNIGSPFSFYFTGAVAEVIIYKRVLDTTERQQVETYLSSKWGL